MWTPSWQPNPRPSTPGERAVLAWCVIVFLLALGLAGLWVGHHASAAQAQQALQLRAYAWVCLAGAFAVWAAYRMFSWWWDR